MKAFVDEDVALNFTAAAAPAAMNVSVPAAAPVAAPTAGPVAAPVAGVSAQTVVAPAK